MTPEEAFNIARQFDDCAVTGNRDSEGHYHSLLLQIHDKQVITIVHQHVFAGYKPGDFRVCVFHEENSDWHKEEYGNDTLWLAALLCEIEANPPPTNPKDLP